MYLWSKLCTWVWSYVPTWMWSYVPTWVWSYIPECEVVYLPTYVEEVMYLPTFVDVMYLPTYVEVMYLWKRLCMYPWKRLCMFEVMYLHMYIVGMLMHFGWTLLNKNSSNFRLRFGVVPLRRHRRVQRGQPVRRQGKVDKTWGRCYDHNFRRKNWRSS
jgi:hypothetical protein